ncbi:MAG: CFI-box-CTERM domain-containing protein [Nitrososphaeria archaeon]
MPSHEEHCQHTLKRYSVRGDDIHSYLDEPCRVAGQGHREFRHDTETVKLVGQVFGKKYGRELAENIALDHIMLDHKEEISKRAERIVLLKCPHCSGHLSEARNGKQVCKYCGYEIKVLETSQEKPVKLPQRGWIVLFRETNDATLPIALPPIEMHDKPLVIDEIYSTFTDREDVQFVLYELGYRPKKTEDFRRSGLTDNEIRQLIIESKKVTVEQIRELLNKAGASLDHCVQCGRHVSKLDMVGRYFFSNHQAVVKKGKVYCLDCCGSAHPNSCYIATAAYGTPMAKELKILRDFRDKKLNPKLVGKQIVILYYRTSPSIAEIISRNEKMKAAVRYALKPMIYALKRRLL